MSKFSKIASVLLTSAFLMSAVSYAITYDSTTTTITAGTNASSTVATNDGKYGVVPAWTNPTTNSTGGLSTPGDLYIVNASSNTKDTVINLYVNNNYDLNKAYTYFNQVVNLYQWNTGTSAWEAVPGVTAQNLSLNNGLVEFKVPGGKKYSLSIDDGNYYNVDNSVPSNLSPNYAIEVK